VLAPPSPFVAGEQPPSWVELEARARHAAERRLALAVDGARRSGLRASAKLIEGPPAEAIVRAARRGSADLVVIGTHGRSGLGRLFMGSVASRVLQLARCPVLTVRGKARRS
jgi:universal stress protein A